MEVPSRAAKHPVDHIVPRGRVTDKIGLQIMNKPPPSLGGGPVHNLSGIREPGRPHYHSLPALPVNLALLDALVLEVVEQAARQQRQQGR